MQHSSLNTQLNKDSNSAFVCRQVRVETLGIFVRDFLNLRNLDFIRRNVTYTYCLHSEFASVSRIQVDIDTVCTAHQRKSKHLFHFIIDFSMRPWLTSHCAITLSNSNRRLNARAETSSVTSSATSPKSWSATRSCRFDLNFRDYIIERV